MNIALTPEDCEVYARLQDAEVRGHMAAAKAAVERARKSRAAALSWRLHGARLRAQSGGPDAEAAGEGAC